LFVVRHVGTARLDTLDTFLDLLDTPNVSSRVETCRDEPSGNLGFTFTFVIGESSAQFQSINQSQSVDRWLALFATPPTLSATCWRAPGTSASKPSKWLTSRNRLISLTSSITRLHRSCSGNDSIRR